LIVLFALILAAQVAPTKPADTRIDPPVAEVGSWAAWVGPELTLARDELSIMRSDGDDLVLQLAPAAAERLCADLQGDVHRLLAFIADPRYAFSEPPWEHCAELALNGAPPLVAQWADGDADLPVLIEYGRVPLSEKDEVGSYWRDRAIHLPLTPMTAAALAALGEDAPPGRWVLIGNDGVFSPPGTVRLDGTLLIANADIPDWVTMPK